MNLNVFETQHKDVDEHADSHTDRLALHDVAHLKQKIEHRKSRQKRIKTIVYSLIGTVVVLLVIVVYSQYKVYQLSQEEKIVTSAVGSEPGIATSTPKTGEQIVRALSKHILLPAGDPQIAEVQDVNKLKQTQSFFKDAQNGDIVIVYETMIYIYRPSADIVIAVSDISGMGQKKP